ncbi:MAG TPA: 16S rRNA (uracil(1498)-N(3))-methyltransferase [Methylocella sp.]|nr:16S rRNA (uracil(1498)-N(3))-methyltransferase [Methylocella sp.]
MPRYDFSTKRLFVKAPLAVAAEISLNSLQTNYVRNVLRLSQGDRILVFNGQDGEWETRIQQTNRKNIVLKVQSQARPQEARPDLRYLFAPLKQARQDYMIEKAVEMGAGHLLPVVTRRTQARRVNLERMEAHAIEAAEQCGILSIPEIAPLRHLETQLGEWDPLRLLIFCDEDAPVGRAFDILQPREKQDPVPLAILIGPEGGFDPAERQLLLSLPFVLRLPLGPRILRADTAAVAALALVQAALGDWRG